MSTTKKISKPKYQKKSQLEHVLTRPDTYIGSLTSRQIEEYVVVDAQFHIEKRKIDISPAILRMFIEPLSNVIDNVTRSKNDGNPTTKICIDIDRKTGEIFFWNNGNYVPIEIHDEEKIYNHTLIFGHLLTGSNFDDTQDREDISGKNGIGVKGLAIFSDKFTVEGGDPINKKSFSQTWTNNMKNAEEPIIKNYKLKSGYTKVTYTLDFKRFGIENYTDDIIFIYKRLIVDTSMITKVPIFLNGEQIPIKTLQEYGNLYNKKKKDEDNIENDEKENLYIKTSTCEVLLTPSSQHEFEHIAFSNGIYNPLGGTHVQSWSEALFRPIMEKLNKPKGPQLSLNDIKKYFTLFVVATVKRPEYDSQSKLKLEAPKVEAEVKKAHISKILSWSVIEQIEDNLRLKEMVVLKKAERKKRGYTKVEGLDPANLEGGKKGRECTLIIVEGLSAKSYIESGIQKGFFGKAGRDYFGILPLSGKILNTRNAKPSSIADNKVIGTIIRAVGLEHGLDYTLDENYNKLRYGKICIVVDGDRDGSHIAGLIQNLFHSLFPTLLKRDPPFLIKMQTPIVRVFQKGGDILFYDEDEFHQYAERNKNKTIQKKYYKGLGTNKDSDAIETFGNKMIEFVVDDHTFDNMNKAFNNKYSDMRKEWLEKYDSNKKVLKWTGNIEEKKSMTYSDFINTELIQFSIRDCQRSIPSLVDGLKESHRKVLYVAFLRNLRYTGQTIKVAQFAGSVSEKSAYHHGEQNLNGTIIGMTQAFVGSNNIPYFYRDGAFGSRSCMGEDAAAARYIYTKLDKVTRLLFRPEDDNLLDYMEDDGEKVEPKFYVPILPTILINGCIGIGTGWSCNIPCYNPLDLISCVKAWLENDNKAFVREEDTDVVICNLPEIIPWYRGHTGEMVKDEEHKFTSWGKIEKDKKDNVVVTELPVGMATRDFVDYLETLKEEKKIANYKNYCTPKIINFVITENDDEMVCNEKNLKLTKTFRTTNMVLFDHNDKLKKYNNIAEIIDDFCNVRYKYYILRKKRQLEELEREIKILGNKKRFLSEVRDGEIKLFEENKNKKSSRSKVDIENELEEKKYDKIYEGNDSYESKGESKSGYDYLLRLQISSITLEKIEKLENDIENRRSEREKLKNTTDKQLWLNDLEEFENIYVPWLDELEAEGNLNKKGDTKKGEKKILGKKKSN
jgi:DNA topoisomerase II